MLVYEQKTSRETWSIYPERGQYPAFFTEQVWSRNKSLYGKKLFSSGSFQIFETSDTSNSLSDSNKFLKRVPPCLENFSAKVLKANARRMTPCWREKQKLRIAWRVQLCFVSVTMVVYEWCSFNISATCFLFSWSFTHCNFSWHTWGTLFKQHTENTMAYPAGLYSPNMEVRLIHPALTEES